MDPQIKDSFQKVKQDIEFLSLQINSLNNQFKEILDSSSSFQSLNNSFSSAIFNLSTNQKKLELNLNELQADLFQEKSSVDSLSKKIDSLATLLEDLNKTISPFFKKTILSSQSDNQTDNPTQILNSSSTPAHLLTNSHNPSHSSLTEEEISALKSLLAHFSSFSSRNEGVPAHHPQSSHNSQIIPANTSFFQTNEQLSPAHNSLFKAQNPQKERISIRNEGVPADSQAVRHSDRQIENSSPLSNVLTSIDRIKKDLQYKFRHLTEQEMLIFSTIYQLEQEGLFVDYKAIADKTNLTQSSIRDYVSKLIKKAIPLQKIKHNNKRIELKIDNSLKEIASLESIITLREKSPLKKWI